MEFKNRYVEYKDKERMLLYWIIDNFNTLARQLSSKSVTENLTGQVSLPILRVMCTAIAEHKRNVLPFIFTLFSQILRLREETHQHYVHFGADDADTRHGNESHKAWIAGIQAAFDILGGPACLGQRAEKEPSEAEPNDLRLAILTNRFSVLHLDGEDAASDPDMFGAELGDPSPSSVKSKDCSKRGGKSTRRKKGKGKDPASRNKFRMEVCCIIDDDEHDINYGMAAHSLLLEWTQLRDYMQCRWLDSAYSELGLGVTGGLAKIAIATLRQREAHVFVDFPNRGSFADVLQALTHGNLDATQEKLRQMKLKSLKGSDTTAAEIDIDVKEQYLVYTYEVLLEFIEDFQKNRTCKPTKNMMKLINSWDQMLDLQKASKEERIQWRRIYAIKWLYEVVTIFASGYTAYVSAKDKGEAASKIDWSFEGLEKNQEYSTLWGMHEFISKITSLAMMKPGSDVKSKITVHQVFELQCVLDSLTVSLGWMVHGYRGHVLRPPPNGYNPTRLLAFLEAWHERCLGRFWQTVTQDEPTAHGVHSLNRNLYAFERVVCANIAIGQCLCARYNLPESGRAAPSLFVGDGETKQNAGGLMIYSPYLCAAGLVEGVQVAYNAGINLMECMPEVIGVIHIHNMLLKTGRLAEPVPTLAHLQKVFVRSFFPNGEIPGTNFEQCFHEIVGRCISFHETRTITKNIAEISKRWNVKRYLADPSLNIHFKTRCMLDTYQQAQWNPDAVRDADVPLPSYLAFLRLGQTRHIVSKTGEKTMLNTELVKRARAEGFTERELLSMAGYVEQGRQLGAERQHSLYQGLFDGPVHRPADNKLTAPLDSLCMLDNAHQDFLEEIHGGNRTVCGLNYLLIVQMCMLWFDDIEEALAAKNHPFWTDVYVNSCDNVAIKRKALVRHVLKEGHRKNGDDWFLNTLVENLVTPSWGECTSDNMYWVEPREGVITFGEHELFWERK
ncbi:hypothetical protein BDW42DRAFT_191283 [Aspergillus taichungensis]|uniref:PH domain-containing protein n=1 Tax=Aspergillus taichungensis TaxID=482145 RepID=A0A2J5I516_9EURO|nr:hypothetical protein BDW42DRAFT_191283 [Aspergillus taichungensis]